MLIDLNRLEEARDALNNALILNPTFDEAWILRAEIMIMLGNYAEAQFCYNEAMKTYDQAIALEPRNIDIILAKAKFLVNLGRSDEAIKVLEAVLGSEINPRVSTKLAEILVNQGRAEEALPLADQSVKASPKSWKSWIVKGKAFSALDRYEDARHCFEVAEKLGGGVEAGQALARTYIALKDFPEAIKALERASNAGRLSPIWRGILLEETGRTEEALEAYLKGTRQKEDNDLAYLRRSQLLTKTGRTKEALRNIDMAIGEAPKKEELWCERGILLLQMGKPHKALKALDTALGLQPDFSRAWLYKGRTLEALNRNEEAKRCFAKAEVKEDVHKKKQPVTNP